jgi:hypothetical protein
VALLLGLAFLTASYPVANSDFFLRLATGRLLAQGEHTFGVDPFTFTTEGTYWVNHAWLFDLLLYALYQLDPSGVLLVVLKALLVVALAGVMLLCARGGAPRIWIPLACTFVALVTLSPRLLLQPVLVSYLFLALTLYLLLSSREHARRAWFIPALCVLWVNLDEWFLLGPLTVALYALGRLLDWRLAEGADAKEEAAARKELTTLGIVLGASLLAGLASPHFVRAYTLPNALGLSEAARVLQDDMQFRGPFISPWEKHYLLPQIGLNAAGLAYYLLLVLGLLSFGLTFGAWLWWRVLLWVAFALLGSYNLRTIPLFAVVAGPIAALNFLDFASARFGDTVLVDRAWRRWGIVGRLLTVLAALVLLAATWPGWLQAEPHRNRRVGWGLRPDESLVRAATQVQSWREAGRLEPGRHWFNTSLDVTDYFAWYCPGERCFLDRRYPLFDKAAADDYLRIRRELRGEGPDAGSKPEPQPPAWVGAFRGRNVQFVAFHTHDLGLAQSVVTLALLYAGRDEWVPCFAEGQAALFGWAGPPGQRRRAAFAGLEVNFDRLAFGPDCALAPPKGARPAQDHPWYEQFYREAPAVSLETGTAQQHLIRYQVFQSFYAQRNIRAWEGLLLARLVGQRAGPGPFILNGLPLALVNSTHWQELHHAPPRAPGTGPSKGEEVILRLRQPFLRAQDQGPPASLYLAVRAARQALAKDPDRPRPYVVLAEAYQGLRGGTKEWARARGLPQVGLIRQTQAAYALGQVLQAAPTPETAQRAHRMLANLYSEGPYFDLHVKHFQEYVKLCKSLRRIPEVPPDKQAKVFEELEKHAQAAQAELEDRKNRYENNALGKQAVARAQAALRVGLGGEALEVLLKVPAEELQGAGPGGPLGAKLELSLLLATGRLSEAQQALTPDESNPAGFKRKNFGILPELGGVPAYEWFLVQYAAGVGNYELADQSLRELLAKARRSPRPYEMLALTRVIAPRDVRDQYNAPREGTAGDLAALSLGSYLLDMAPRAAGRPYLFSRPLALDVSLAEVQNLIGREITLHTLRAWLALEAGTLARAREALADADRLSTIDHGKKGKTFLITSSRPLLELCHELLERGDKADGKR